jgi:hypothetical protein
MKIPGLAEYSGYGNSRLQQRFDMAVLFDV